MLEHTEKEIEYYNNRLNNNIVSMVDRVFILSEAIPGLKEAAQNGDIIDLTIPGACIPVENDGIVSSMVVALDPASPEVAIATLPPGRRYILLRNILHQIKDYRSTIRATFERVAVGGWLIISVPHQFLAERKYRLPSRYNTSVLRMYTPAALISEIEESLDPTEYRLRFLCDDDTNYDYSLEIHERPEGNQRIVAAIQRIQRPHWAGQLMEGDCPEEAFNPNDRIVPKKEGPVSTHIIYPTSGTITKILVIKLDHRGDYLMAIPAFSELRARFVDAQITFVCGNWNVDAARQSGFFDEILPFNFFAEDMSFGKALRHNRATRIFAQMMMNRHFDLAIDMRFFDDSRSLLRIVKAECKAGFDRWNRFPWLDITLTLPSPSIDGHAEQMVWPVDAFSSDNELRKEGCIVIPAGASCCKPDIAVYGPYKTLSEGRYTVHLYLDSLGDNQDVLIDVVHDSARKCLFAAELPVGPDGCKPICFDLLEPAHDVEIRISWPDRDTSALSFKGARLIREGAIVGVHQREAMYLLIQLIMMRLSAPYKHDRAGDLS